jgi:hypothetical protein
MFMALLSNSSQEKQRQANGRWGRLDIEDFAAGRGRTIDSRDENAAKKEHLHCGSASTETQPPEQPGGQEAVVQALVRSQDLGRGRCLLCLAKRPQPGWLVPEKHFEDQEVEVQKRNDAYDDVCGE